MRILLTGPSGFIGSSFLRLALARGHELAGLLLPAEPVPAGMPPSQRLTWMRGTLAEAPWHEIEAFRPEVCVHTAWITTPGVYLESPENDRFRDGSFEFLRRAVQTGARHVVGLGTCIEYQITDQPLNEERTPILPTTRYARCKNELRLALEREAASAGFEFCWCRIFYPYGPGEHPSRLCTAILRKLSRREQVVLNTPGSTKDYVYIEDLASALLTVVERRPRGAINLGTGTGTTVEQIAFGLGRLLGRPELIEAANPLGSDPFPFVVADATRLKSLGWEPKWTMEEGLERLVQAHGGQT